MSDAFTRIHAASTAIRRRPSPSVCVRPTCGSRGRILVDVFFRLSHQPMFRRTRWAATRLFPFQSEFSIDFGGKGFSNDPLWPPFGPFVAPAMARLWPLVARCGPLVAPCGPFVFYGRTFEKFSRGPLCGPPGHRATRNFSKVRIFGFFFIFRPTVYEEKKRKNYTFSSLSIPSTVGRKMKKTRNPNL